MTEQELTKGPSSDIEGHSLELGMQALTQNRSVTPGGGEELLAAEGSYRPQNEGPGSTRPPA